MSPTTTLVFFSFLLPLLLLLCFFFFIRKPSSKNVINGGKLPPSPPRLPIIGNLHQLGSLPYRSLSVLADKHGPLMLLKLGSIPTIVVSSEEMAREVTKAQGQNFDSRPSTAFIKKFSYDRTDVAYAPYGEYWRQVRKITVLHLLSAKKVQSFGRVREEEVALMVESIKKECSCFSNGGGGVVNLSKMLVSLSNDIVSRVSLGKKLYGEEGTNSSRFGELMKESGTLYQAIHVADYFPRLGWLSKLSGLEARMKRHAKEWDDFLNEVNDDHLLQRSSSSSGSEEAHQEDLLDVLLSLRHDESLTMDNVKALILEMLTGGSSSSIAIDWTIAELIRNPLVMKKVQEEIRAILVGKTAIEEEDISKMLYLKAVIKEALRLHPPGPIISREAVETTHIKGYEIPRSTVMINVWSIGRASESWDSPEKFLPERFLDSSVDFKGNDFHYIVFGADRRICPGILFATSIIELSLANLLHYFDWSLPHGKNHEDLNMAESFNGFMMRRKYDLVLVPTQYASTRSS